MKCETYLMNSHLHCQSKKKIANGTMIIFSISAILFLKYIKILDSSKLKTSSVSNCNWMENIISNLMFYYILCFIFSYKYYLLQIIKPKIFNHFSVLYIQTSSLPFITLQNKQQCTHKGVSSFSDIEPIVSDIHFVHTW